MYILYNYHDAYVLYPVTSVVALKITVSSILRCRIQSLIAYFTQDILLVGLFCILRDWSLITGRGGATKWENRRSETFCAPPSRQGKSFRAPPFKEWKLFGPPYNMVKTSSYRVKTTPKHFPPPPSAWLKLFPPPLFVGVKLHVPPPPIL